VGMPSWIPRNRERKRRTRNSCT